MNTQKESIQVTTEEKTLIEHYRSARKHCQNNLLILAKESAEVAGRLTAKGFAHN